MNSFAFDTHAFFKSLTYAGMEEQQAEALLEFQNHLINDSLATKRDIGEVKASIEEVKASVEALRLKTEQSIGELKVDLEKVKGEVEKVKGEVEKLRLEIKKDMKALELHLTLRLASVIILTTGLFATLVKLLP